MYLLNNFTRIPDIAGVIHKKTSILQTCDSKMKILYLKEKKLYFG